MIENFPSTYLKINMKSFRLKTTDNVHQWMQWMIIFHSDDKMDFAWEIIFCIQFFP